MELIGARRLLEGQPMVNIVDVEKQLKGLGYKNLRRESGKTLKVLVDGNRQEVMQRLTHQLPGAKHIRTTVKSSIGHIEYEGINLLIKPSAVQGRAAYGLGNEDLLAKKINQVLTTVGKPINIIFAGSNRSFTASNITEAQTVGNDTTGFKKADIRLTGQGNVYNFSLKKDNAEYWESGDTAFRSEASIIITKLIRQGKVRLRKDPTSKVYRLDRSIAASLHPEEIHHLVFGTDIKPNTGGVLIRTFSDDDFYYDAEKNELTIQVTKILIDVADFGDNAPVVLIRNDATRAGVLADKGMRGIRAMIVSASRVRMGEKKAQGQKLLRSSIVYVQR